MIALRRLHAQLLAGNALDSPHAVVSHLGAVQAQDYLGALWAVGMRTRSAVERDVERALADRSIVRCWPMRGTLHFVAAEDVRWMLELLAARVLARHRARLEREFELDAKTVRRARTLVERALRGGNALTRPEIYEVLDGAGVATRASRGLHILFTLAHERRIVFGARRGKQATFVLLDEWLPAAKAKSREESLAEIARRYFTSHAPATIADLMWWSGLTMKEAKEGIALAGVDLDRSTPAAKTPNVRLLPPFDEFTVAYRDRSDIVDPAFANRGKSAWDILNSVLVIDGRVTGAWKRTLRGGKVEVTVTPFRTLTTREVQAVGREEKRYANFLSSVDEQR